jgi:transcriptional regulator
MYVPEMFAVTDPDEIDLILSTLRLGCLVTRDEQGFFGTHIPMQFDARKRVLNGHVSKGNPHHTRTGDGEALAIFQGMNAYVSPNWYPSKLQHGKVVPTWNYEVVHVSGKVVWKEDADWLRQHLVPMIDHHETGQTKPWKLTDAPDDYMARMLSQIVGLELEVRNVQIKRKLSQNRADADRLGAIAGLLNSDNAADQEVGRAMIAGGHQPSG